MELEFRESMTHRMEKGYILPGQAQLLCTQKEIAALLTRYPRAAVAAIDAEESAAYTGSTVRDYGTQHLFL